MAFPKSAGFSFVMSLDAMPQAIGSAGAKRVGGGYIPPLEVAAHLAIMLAVENPWVTHFYCSCTAGSFHGVWTVRSLDSWES